MRYFFCFLGALWMGTTAASAQTLSGYAVLPAKTWASGPTSRVTSGQKIESPLAPFTDKQPIQGFSSLWRAFGGNFWALEDNGFGAKANSDDFLLCITLLGRDFTREQGKTRLGSGKISAKAQIELRDPQKLIPWPLVRADRFLTGADFDPESLVLIEPKDDDGTQGFWIGEEFGPFLLHFSADGALLDAPFALPNVVSPDDPLQRAANLASSRGFEGLALAPDQRHLWALLEGALKGENPRALHAFEFDTRLKKWTGREFVYPLEASATAGKEHSIGEMTALDGDRFLIIERDGLEAEAAQFKRIYEFDWRRKTKKLVADLMNIRDPQGLSSSPNGVYAMPFQTIESVLVLDSRRLLVCNDNNFPFSRGRGELENTEFAVISLEKPLF